MVQDPLPDPTRMHTFTPAMEALADEVIAYTYERFAMNPPPLDGPQPAGELDALTGRTVTPAGLGGTEALRLWVEVLAPACISQDHPRALSFVPSAPTEASSLFDLVVGASSIYGGSWLEGAGAVHAENAALRWVADLAGLPPEAGGVFVPGGTVGNLSALVTARHAARTSCAGELPARWKVAATTQAHSSIKSACDVMDVDFIGVPVDDEGRLTGENLRATLEAVGTDGLFAVVATAGTTNFGIVDD